MTPPPSPTPAPRAVHASLRGLVVKLTLLFWMLLFVTFAGTIAATAEAPLPGWIWLWLTAISLTGLMFSFALAALYARVAGYGGRGRWMAVLGGVALATTGQTVVDGLLNGIVSTGSLTAVTETADLAHYALNALIYAWVFGFNAVALALVGELNRSVLRARFEAAHAVESSAKRERAARIREQAGQAQLDALRFQVDPHFLFNTLNGISSLVLAGRAEAAEAMIQKFVAYLRLALKDTEGGLVSLDRELVSAEAYLAVEGARFNDAVAISIDCPPPLRDAIVPNLILRPLLECAVRHATDSGRSDEIRLSVAKVDTGLTIAVCCAGPVRSDGQTQAAVALVQSRLEAVYGEEAGIRFRDAPTGVQMDLLLPLVRSGEMTR